MRANGLPYSQMVTMNVTLAGAFALISRGQLSGGEVVFVTSPLQEAGTATVNIQAWFQRHELMNLAKACAVTRRHHVGEDGVALFVSPGHSYVSWDLYTKDQLCRPRPGTGLVPFDLRTE